MTIHEWYIKRLQIRDRMNRWDKSPMLKEDFDLWDFYWDDLVCQLEEHNALVSSIFD